MLQRVFSLTSEKGKKYCTDSRPREQTKTSKPGNPDLICAHFSLTTAKCQFARILNAGPARFPLFFELSYIGINVRSMLEKNKAMVKLEPLYYSHTWPYQFLMHTEE